ncbi:MAG: tRNA (adenosine(37)-N6)-dimethylallyltransferase MiaA [bacterium]|nr:tRNA (adenosine(37)-N6)-dimethylallyltransferase MiaA [bacterium]
MNPSLSKVITILGVTSSGKTGLAVELAKNLPAQSGQAGEIVSADSRQIYKEFNIGTAKPEGIWQDSFIYKDIPHYLIDFINPTKEFTLAEYQKLATQKLKEIASRGKIPFLVGGTPLYLKAVLENWNIPEVKPNLELRAELEQKDTLELFNTLKEKDPEAADLTGDTNKRRIIRALEVIAETGEKFSSQRKIGKPIFDSLKIGIQIEREELVKRITERTKGMFKNGLAKEVKNLSEKYGWDIPPMQSIGYQEFKNETNLSKVESLIIQNTLAYTKRQMTWFKKDKDIVWITSPKEAEEKIKSFLN